MKKLILVILLFSIAGCATTSAINMKRVVAESTQLSNNQNINIINIPSHGALGDSLAVAADGGANAKAARETIEKLSNAGGGTLIITSTNPELAKVNIISALKGIDSKKTNIFLIYAGTEKYSDEVRKAAEDKGMQYGFVEAYRK